MTKYAEKILQLVLASHRHPTVEEIHDMLRQSCPKVALATVYNNLNRLCGEGYLRRITMEGWPDRFDRPARHDHLVCSCCGRLADVELSDLTAQLETQLGMPILGYDLKLLYCCEACGRERRKRGLAPPGADK